MVGSMADSAKQIYLDGPAGIRTTGPDAVSGFVNAVCTESDPSEEAVLAALEDGPYGRCGTTE